MLWSWSRPELPYLAGAGAMEKGAAPAGAGAVAAILTSWSPSRVKIERLHDHNTVKVYGGVNFKRRLRCASGAKRIWHEFVSN